MKRFLATTALLAGISGLAGCSHDNAAAMLDVHRDHAGVDYTAKFDRALFTQSSAGQVDVILLQGSGRDPSIDRPLSADEKGGVQQVVHVKVLWNPTRTIRLDSPSASNAFIDWHVVAGEKNRVSYTGSCWAMTDIDGDEATIDLRNATVTLSSITGNMSDPLRRASLTGKIKAKRADALVESYVAQIDQLNHKSATAMSEPTPRHQTMP